MADRADLPAVATPWEDPLGNVWCATAKRPMIEVWEWDRDQWEWDRDHWKLFDTRSPVLVNSTLLAGLGRTLPAGPTAAPTPPKRVAKVVRLGMWELAVKRDQLYERSAGVPWRPANDWSVTYDLITAAAEAFAGAGEVLPGEAE